MATTINIRPVEQYLMETEGFFFAKVTMFRQDRTTGKATDIVDTYEGFIKQDGGLIWMIRPEANMRSNNKKEICTVSQRLISINKGA